MPATGINANNYVDFNYAGYQVTASQALAQANYQLAFQNYQVALNASKIPPYPPISNDIINALNTAQQQLNTAQQTTILLTGADALKNVIKMYLMSYPGDYGREIAKGGPLINFIGKALTPSNQSALKQAVTTAINSITVDNSIVVANTDVTMDTTNKKFIVTVTFYDNYNKLVNSINVAINATV